VTGLAPVGLGSGRTASRYSRDDASHSSVTRLCLWGRSPIVQPFFAVDPRRGTIPNCSSHAPGVVRWRDHQAGSPDLRWGWSVWVARPVLL